MLLLSEFNSIYVIGAIAIVFFQLRKLFCLLYLHLEIDQDSYNTFDFKVMGNYTIVSCPVACSRFMPKILISQSSFYILLQTFREDKTSCQKKIQRLKKYIFLLKTLTRKFDICYQKKSTYLSLLCQLKLSARFSSFLLRHLLQERNTRGARKNTDSSILILLKLSFVWSCSIATPVTFAFI